MLSELTVVSLALLVQHLVLWGLSPVVYVLQVAILLALDHQAVPHVLQGLHQVQWGLRHRRHVCHAFQGATSLSQDLQAVCCAFQVAMLLPLDLPPVPPVVQGCFQVLSERSPRPPACLVPQGATRGTQDLPPVRCALLGAIPQTLDPQAVHYAPQERRQVQSDPSLRPHVFLALLISTPSQAPHRVSTQLPRVHRGPMLLERAAALHAQRGHRRVQSELRHRQRVYGVLMGAMLRDLDHQAVFCVQQGPMDLTVGRQAAIPAVVVSTPPPVPPPVTTLLRRVHRVLTLLERTVVFHVLQGATRHTRGHQAVHCVPPEPLQAV